MIQIELANEHTSNEDMIQLALETGHMLGRIFPDNPYVATVDFQYGEERTGQYQNRRGRRSLVLIFNDDEDYSTYEAAKALLS